MCACVSWHLACQFLSLSLPSSVFSWTQGREAASLLSPRDCALLLPLSPSPPWSGDPGLAAHRGPSASLP